MAARNARVRGGIVLPMRSLPLVLLAGCVTAASRDVEVPAPYEASGLRIEIEPQVRRIYCFQEIRGTVRNGTEEAADVGIVLDLFDDGEARVGQAIGFADDLRPGESRPFVASVFPWVVPDPADPGGDARKYVPLPFRRAEPGRVLTAPPRDKE